MTFCAVTQDLNRWLASQDLSEAKQEAIAEEAEKLQEKGQDYYPFAVCNVSEAIGEMSAIDYDRIAQFYEQGNSALAGGVLLCAITNYWQEMAEKKAEEIITQQWQERQERDPDDYRDDRNDY